MPTCGGLVQTCRKRCGASLVRRDVQISAAQHWLTCGLKAVGEVSGRPLPLTGRWNLATGLAILPFLHNGGLASLGFSHVCSPVLTGGWGERGDSV